MPEERGMAAAQRSIRSMLSPKQQSKRADPTVKDDKHMRHGHLVLSAHQSKVPLERLLAVAKLAVTFLTDILRQSEDAQDIPIMILGHHYISHRKLGEGSAANIPGTRAMPGAAAAPAAPPTGPAVPAAAAGVGTTFAAYVQEICTFDAREGPKSFTGVEGVPLALVDFQLQPLAVAKAKRLGREISIKVGLNPTGSSSRLQLLEWREDYSITWPSMQLLAATIPRCPVAFKGELAISCLTTGLLMSLSFVKGNSVKGTIEQLKDLPVVPTAAAAAAAGGSQTLSGALLPKPQKLGSVSGYWTSMIYVSCPKLGLEGVLYDGASIAPAPVPSIDLSHLGPMKLSRVWSAIHDSLLYADPKLASGGRAAAKLAVTMSHYLSALTLDSASSRDVAGMPAAGTAAAAAAAAGGGGAASATTAGRTAASTGGPLSSQMSVGEADSDIEEFDRLLEGKSKDTEDNRAVPPCYKEQHAAGNVLKYVLHYTLTSMPGMQGT